MRASLLVFRSCICTLYRAITHTAYRARTFGLRTLHVCTTYFQLARLSTLIYFIFKPNVFKNIRDAKNSWDDANYKYTAKLLVHTM